MATKKQRREAGEARARAQEAALSVEMTRNLTRAREAREARSRKIAEEAAEMNKRHNAILAMHGIAARR